MASAFYGKFCVVYQGSFHLYQLTSHAVLLDGAWLCTNRLYLVSSSTHDGYKCLSNMQSDIWE